MRLGSNNEMREGARDRGIGDEVTRTVVRVRRG